MNSNKYVSSKNLEVNKKTEDSSKSLNSSNINFKIDQQKLNSVKRIRKSSNAVANTELMHSSNDEDAKNDEDTIHQRKNKRINSFSAEKSILNQSQTSYASSPNNRKTKLKGNINNSYKNKTLILFFFLFRL